MYCTYVCKRKKNVSVFPIRHTRIGGNAPLTLILSYRWK